MYSRAMILYTDLSLVYLKNLTLGEYDSFRLYDFCSPEMIILDLPLTSLLLGESLTLFVSMISVVLRWSLWTYPLTSQLHLSLSLSLSLSLFSLLLFLLSSYDYIYLPLTSLSLSLSLSLSSLSYFCRH